MRAVRILSAVPESCAPESLRECHAEGLLHFYRSIHEGAASVTHDAGGAIKTGKDMKSLWPARSNAAYGGLIVASWVLGIYGALRILTGSVHMFWDDGGAGRIAGLNLDADPMTLIAVFAWAGATQLVWGCATLGVALWYRSLVAPALLLALVEQSLIAINAWVLKPVADGHHPPATYVALAGVWILALGLLSAFWRKR